ncbi:hypothetical protein K439DRAFT_1613161 [Ramaria rubella]|nr:hypothetical protein K439DRAFT_1613161 [Ramaria rubella]
MDNESKMVAAIRQGVVAWSLKDAPTMPESSHNDVVVRDLHSVNISTPVKNSENARIEGPEHIEILLGLQHDPNARYHLMFLPVFSRCPPTQPSTLSPRWR